MLRLPGWTWRDLGPDGGLFDQHDRPKVLVHTTEGSTLEGAESAFKTYPPHLGYDPQSRLKRQYVSLDRHSYSIRNIEAEDDYVIQIEVVAFAGRTHTWPDQWYKNFADDVILPLENAIDVPRRFMRFYGEMDGIVLASKYSPIRLSNYAWRAFSGWIGHQHAPNPDEHWDPGKFLMDKAMRYATKPTPPDILEEDYDVSVAYVHGDSKVKIPNSKYTWGDIVFLVEWDVQEGVARSRVVNASDPGYALWQAMGRPVKVIPQDVLDKVTQHVDPQLAANSVEK